MDASLTYAVGTLAAWTAWVALFRGIYLGLAWALRASSSARDGIWAGLAWSAGIAASGFILSGSLLPRSEEAGFRLPVFWPVMPFSAWAALVGFLFMGARVIQALFAANRAESQAKWIAAGASLVVAALFVTLFLRSKGTIDVLQGGIKLEFGTAVGLAVLLIAVLAVMVASARSARLRGWAKASANHLALLAGSLMFGLPFAWAVITSFKEDQDMSSPEGLVWVPHVRQRVPYYDPSEERAEGRFEGQTVEGIVQEKRSDGSARIEIIKPAVLRGMTFVEPNPKTVPKMVDVVKSRLEGREIKGKVIREFDDGRKRIEVMEPASMKGTVFEAESEKVELVRPIGLNYLNYPEALDYLPPETMKGLLYLRNTLIIVVLSVIGTLLSSSIVAYAFARLRFPGKNALFLVLLSTMMLPAAVTLIPQFLIFRWLGWIDTLRPLWVPAFLGSAFNIFLLRQFFMTIPLELEDAAKIDGCSYPRTFWQVMLPQVKPALAVVAIWTFMGAWNNFMGPLIYINSPENMPISYAVQLFQGDRLNEPGLLMAFATMAMLPVLLVFFFAQRYFIEGVTLSGLGGR